MQLLAHQLDLLEQASILPLQCLLVRVLEVEEGLRLHAAPDVRLVALSRFLRRVTRMALQVKRRFQLSVDVLTVLNLAAFNDASRLQHAYLALRVLLFDREQSTVLSRVLP